MDKDDADREEDCCARCRWMEMRARPYGAVDYLCGRRGEEIASCVIAERRCSEFEP